MKFNSEMLATACEDNLVRIYNCKNTQSNPVKVFIGHSGKVFSVKWSPIREGVFCSSSDDCTVRVWDFSSTSSVSVLNGHTSYVRGILWNHEIPYILMTSSWDATIRVWDIRDETCLCVNSDHGADVYGLASHAVRPFTVASASRDSTVRLWSISSFVSCLHAKLLAGELWKNVIGNPDQLVNPSSPPLLCGKQSKAILTVLSKSSSKRKTTDLTLFAELFGTVCGENNIFDLVSIQLGCNDADLGILYKNGIMHRKHIIKYRLDQAHKEEMAKFGNIGIGNKTKKFQLSSAARLHLRAGNIQRYCELMIELGQWEKALSISPAVSIDYWKSLTKRRAESLMDEDNESALEYSMACGIVDVYIDNLLGKGNLEDAYELSIANEDGYLSCPVATSSNVCFSTNVTDQGYAKKSATALSNYYFDFGSPIKAACCYLAIDDVESTLATLLRGNELELTITLGQVLGRMNSHHVKKALLYLSYKLQRHGHWNLSVDLLKLGFDVEDYLMQACMLCPLSVTDQNYLREKAGVPYIDDCLMEAKRSAEKGSTLEAIKYHLLSPEPLEGLELGVLYINKLMKNSNWDDVRNVVNWMSAIKTIKLQHSSCDRFRTELLAICAYNGGVEAIRRNYTSVVGLLMSHAIDLYKRVASSSDCVLNDVIIESELDSWNVMNYKSKRSGKNVLCQPTDYQKSMYRSLMSKVGQLSDYILTEDIGEVKVLGSNLPSYSNTHTCCLTNNVIQGPIHILEDGISAMNLNDAIMWARVNHFSPTSTGARIHPF
ncbi:WDR17 (predicted) [Pycnogonum litorale]